MFCLVRANMAYAVAEAPHYRLSRLDQNWIEIVVDTCSVNFRICCDSSRDRCA
jgi:hypothetical protein